MAKVTNESTPKPKTTITYYGKKTYHFKVVIARKKAKVKVEPNYLKEKSELKS